MKNSIKIFLILITSLLLINLVNASSIIMISSKYETKIKCDEMKKKNTDDNKITVKYNRSECYFKKGKYIYNVCKDGTVCPTGDNDKNYSSQQSTSNNDDIPYKYILDELLRIVKLKKAEKTDKDFEVFLNSAIDYVNKLGEKEEYKNYSKTKAIISYLQNGLNEIKKDFDKNKNDQKIYNLFCDLGSCDKNNFVTNNNNNNNNNNNTTNNTNSSEEVCTDEERKNSFNRRYESIYDYPYTYKDQFDPKRKLFKSVRHDLKVNTFKVFFPKGVKKLNLTMFFMGMFAQRCDSGISIKYWINNSIAESNIKRGNESNDLWRGKYMESLAIAENHSFTISSKDGNPSEEAKWIYFSIDMPCKYSFIEISSNFGSLDNNKYTDWYNKAKWEENGDPAYDCGIVKPNFPICFGLKVVKT